MNRLKFYSLIVLLCLCRATGSLAEEPRPAKAERTQVEFYGTVRNAAGEPVPNCEVTFSAPWRDKWDRFWIVRSIDNATPALLTTHTDSHGNYRVKVDLTDSRWLGAGDGTVVVHSSTGGWAAESFLLNRGLVDLPLDFQLNVTQKISVQVVDDAGAPIANARILPARFGKVSLPRQLGERFATTTDQTGRAEIVRVHPDLRMVYVQHTEFGQRCNYVEPTDDGGGKAVLPRSISSQLRFKHVDPNQTNQLPAIAWTAVSFTGQGDKLSAGWQELRTSLGQNSTPLSLPPGNLYFVTDYQTGHALFVTDRNSSLSAATTEIDITLERGLHITGKVADSKTGSPLPGITLMHSGKLHVLSRSDGTFEAWLPKLNDGFYPVDSLNRHFLQAAFYVRPNAETSPGEATVQPFEMIPSQEVIGTVLAPDGKPLPGVNVTCQSKQERFTNSVNFLSDRQGRFVITGLDAGAPVKLSVADRRGVTETPVEVSLNPREGPTIRLVPANPIRFLGRTVDSQGTPIIGAEVSILRGQVMIDNGYQPIEYQSVDAFNSEPMVNSHTIHVRSDSQGRFRSPECFDTRHRFAVHIRHAGHFEKRTSYRAFSRQDESTAYDFGDLVLRTIPSSDTVQIDVKGVDDRPIAGATVVLAQPGIFGGKGTTQADGSVSLQAKNCPGVVGAFHPEYGAFVTAFHPKKSNARDSSADSTFPIVLDKTASAQPWLKPQSTIDKRRSLAKQLLNRFEFVKQPKLDGASYFEATTMLGGMAFADPVSTMAFAVTNKAELEKRAEIGQTLIFKIAQREPNMLTPLMPLIPPMLRANMLVNQASDLSVSTENRLKTIEQAIPAARQMQGDEAAVVWGKIVMLLIELGESETAVELVKEFFEDYKDEATSANGQRSKRGVARYFYPQLGLADFPLACKLIQKQAYPLEIEGLQSLSLLLAVMTGNIDWNDGLKQVGQTALTQAQEALVPGVFGRTPLPNRQFVDEFASRIASPRRRGLLYIGAAMRIPQCSTLERQELLTMGIDALAGDVQPADSSYFNSLAYQLKDEWLRLQTIDPALARRAAFLCLLELSDHRDGQYSYLAERTALVAQSVAHLNVELSQILLEPFVEDLTWRFTARDIGSILPLSIAAGSNPEWACSKAQALMDGEFNGDILRQMLVVDTIIEGLAGQR